MRRPRLTSESQTIYSNHPKITPGSNCVVAGRRMSTTAEPRWIPDSSGDSSKSNPDDSGLDK